MISAARYHRNHCQRTVIAYNECLMYSGRWVVCSRNNMRLEKKSNRGGVGVASVGSEDAT